MRSAANRPTRLTGTVYLLRCLRARQHRVDARDDHSNRSTETRLTTNTPAPMKPDGSSRACTSFCFRTSRRTRSKQRILDDAGQRAESQLRDRNARFKTLTNSTHTAASVSSGQRCMPKCTEKTDKSTRAAGSPDALSDGRVLAPPNHVRDLTSLIGSTYQVSAIAW